MLSRACLVMALLGNCDRSASVPRCLAVSAGLLAKACGNRLPGAPLVCAPSGSGRACTLQCTAWLLETPLRIFAAGQATRTQRRQPSLPKSLPKSVPHGPHGYEGRARAAAPCTEPLASHLPSERPSELRAQSEGKELSSTCAVT